MPEYNKLVRGRIPEIISANGETPIYRTITDDDEFIDKAIRKVVEEAGELAAATTLQGRREEVADLLKITEALKTQLGADEIDEISRHKDTERGGFDQRIFLERTE